MYDPSARVFHLFTSKQRSLFHLLWLVLLSTAVLSVLAPRVCAQDNATITGTVLDPSRAAVGNATIKITNVATGQVRQVTSNSAGVYVFPNVGVGTYNLSATASGFQEYRKTGIVVNVAQTLSADIPFTIGSSQQSVTVEAQALQVQSETNEISSLISGQQVTQSATNGRNVTQLASLGMGKSNNLPAFGGVNALTSASGISFNGTRSTHNIYLLDGGELNDRGCGGCLARFPLLTRFPNSRPSTATTGQTMESARAERLLW